MLDALEWSILDENRFTGTLPSELGQLSSVLVLYTYSNPRIGGTIPSQLGLLPAVELLSLRECSLTGTIPTQLGLLTTLASALGLRYSQLTGPIPSQLGRLTLLRELELRGNHLTGSIPSQLGLMTSMGYLTLANNSLSGSFPSELSALRESLFAFYIEGNPLLSGTIPDALCGPLNGTCVNEAINFCEDGPFRLTLDCTDLLCGCECPCSSL